MGSISNLPDQTVKRKEIPVGEKPEPNRTEPEPIDLKPESVEIGSGRDAEIKIELDEEFRSETDEDIKTESEEKLESEPGEDLKSKSAKEAKPEPVKTEPKLVIIKPLKKKPVSELTCVITNGTGKLNSIKKRGHFFYLVTMSCAPITVLIQKDSFYINEELCSSWSTVRKQENREVNFDAVQILGSRSHRSGATYISILAWVGKKPTLSLLEKFDVPPINPICPGIVYIGIVPEKPAPDHCFVKIGEVYVFVSSSSLLVDAWTKDSASVAVTDYLSKGSSVAVTCKNSFEAELCGSVADFESEFEVGIYDKKAQFESRLTVDFNENVSSSEVEARLIKMLLCSHGYLKENVMYKGIVVSLPFLNYAVAVIGVFRILIHVSKLINFKKEDDGEDGCIRQHLQIGSQVLLWIERRTYENETYYFAKEVQKVAENHFKETVFRNCNGKVNSIDANKVCVIEWNRGTEFRRVPCDFSILRDCEAMSERFYSNGQFSIGCLLTKLYDGASIKVVEVKKSESDVEMVIEGVWLALNIV